MYSQLHRDHSVGVETTVEERQRFEDFIETSAVTRRRFGGSFTSLGEHPRKRDLILIHRSVYENGKEPCTSLLTVSSLGHPRPAEPRQEPLSKEPSYIGPASSTGRTRSWCYSHLRVGLCAHGLCDIDGFEKEPCTKLQSGARAGPHTRSNKDKSYNLGSRSKDRSSKGTQLRTLAWLN